MTWRIIDLFSGIGGFSLAAQWCWGNELEIVAFCEIDKFCQKVFRKHWPDVPIIEDVRNVREKIVANFTGNRLETGRMAKEGSEEQPSRDSQTSINLLTGGFPCQPFSVAGKRKGKEDNRFLWPEMFRVIKEIRPRWIVAENVAGIVRMALDDCLSDLEGEGYSTGTVIIPACAVNAPHRRDRVWIVAYAKQSCGGGGISERLSNGERRIAKTKSESLQPQIREAYRGNIEQGSQDVANGSKLGWVERANEEGISRFRYSSGEFSDSSKQLGR